MIFIGILVMLTGGIIFIWRLTRFWRGKTDYWVLIPLGFILMILGFLIIMFTVNPVSALGEKTQIPALSNPSCSDTNDRSQNRLIWDALNGRKGLGFQSSGDYMVIYYQHVGNDELIAMEAALNRWGWQKTKTYDTGEEWKKPNGFDPCPPPLGINSFVTWPMMLILLLMLIFFALGFFLILRPSLRRTTT